MQVPPQLTCEPAHDSAHVPPLQTLPAVHAVPALPVPPTPQPAVAPQLSRLVSASTQVPPQLIWLPGHETAHVPLAQTFPAMHAVPALPVPPTPQPLVAPQLDRLVMGSTQLPPQLI
jgi:hypothetical protein